MAFFTGFSGAPFSKQSKQSLAKQITEVWRVLNETALLLSRTIVKSRFENQLAVLRSELQRAPANPGVLREVSVVLTDIRKQLRMAGYDLSMGKYTLIFDGFRNDDSAAEGFQRLVLFIGDKDLYWKTGDENHLLLASVLGKTLEKSSKRVILLEMHYLWFLRTKTTLTLSGAVTETEEDYQKLKVRGEADNLLFLSKLKGIY
jgi:hypothetical protein